MIPRFKLMWSALLMGLGGIGMSPVYGVDYFVSSLLGSDDFDGKSPDSSQGSGPVKTLERAQRLINNAKPGDRILFRKGDVWYGQLKISAVGAEQNRITIGSYGIGAKPKIVSNKWGGAVLSIRGHYSFDRAPAFIAVKDLHITTDIKCGTGKRPSGIRLAETARPYPPHDILFDAIRVEGLRSGGSIYADNVAIKNSEFLMNYSCPPYEKGHSQGLFVAGNHSIIENNKFIGNGKSDSWFDWQTYLSHSSGHRYVNNKLKDGPSGLKLRGVSDVVVAGNTIEGMRWAGISLGADTSRSSTNITVHDNIIERVGNAITIKDQSNNDAGNDVQYVSIFNNEASLDNTLQSGVYKGYFYIADKVKHVQFLDNRVKCVTRPVLQEKITSSVESIIQEPEIGACQ